jgi:chitodextrinase
MGDVQAIEYDAGTIYFSFHEGFQNDGTVRMLAVDSATGNLDPAFRPTVNSFFGVWSIDSANGTLAAGGEFTNFDGRQVQGLAIMQSRFADDETPPSVPSNLTNTSRTATSAGLSWGASTDDTLLTGYEVVRDGVQVGASTTTTLTDTNLAPGTEYVYRVRAVDAAGNRSALSGPLTVTTPVPLVSAGATWRYLDNGSDQGTAWRARTFNDGAWASGPAQLGYGDGDESTVVSFGPNPNARYRTTYFRHTFDVANPAQVDALTMRLLRDDGAVVYLNGSEVARSNMPATWNFNTLAPSNVDGAAESTFFTFTPAPGLLVAGSNTLAVEVHQNSNASSDVSFDLALDADVTPGGGGGDTEPPTAPGSLTLGPVTSGSVALSWQASTDDTGVAQYVVRRNGTAVGTTDGATSFTDTPVDDGHTYTYTVVARDAAGNVSAESNAVVANTPDVTAPSVPGPLTASGVTTNAATVSWPASTDNVGVTQYVVRRDGVVVSTQPGTSFNDSGLAQEASYSYTVTAADAAGNVSNASAALVVTTAGPNSTQTLVAQRSVWRYLDNGSNQGTAWRNPGFNDASWAQGAGILGYGGSGGYGTVVSFGPNASQKYLTTYFRRTFTVANAASVQSLLLRLLRDDGAVVYVNGTEVARSNMPAGTITSGSFASTNVNAPQDRQYFNFTVPTNLLVSGTNTIAVEIHQNYRASGDIAFDAELIANP